MRLYENILAELNATPGVRSAALARMPLLQGWAPSWNMQVEGYRPADGEDVEVANNVVAPGFFRTVGIRLLKGRLLDHRDLFDFSEGNKTPTRAVVNRNFTWRFFPNAGFWEVGQVLSRTDDDQELGILIITEFEFGFRQVPRMDGKPANLGKRLIRKQFHGFESGFWAAKVLNTSSVGSQSATH